jgi:ATP-dependent exoDNAse (exonuclease V) alpha subunit
MFFGGIQIIAIGDFYQLSPVKNSLYAERGEFCFESEIWLQTLSHHVHLEEVVRQEELELITAVRETAVGSVSPQTEELLKNKENDLEHVAEITLLRLFPTNFLKDMCNAAMFNALEGSQKCYPSQDTGQQKYIKIS